MKDSKIEWTHHTFNPWWGCVKVSAGCTHCYAETFSKRTGHNIWGVDAERRMFGDKHWNEPYKWNEEAKKAGERRRVFCASMADVFEDRRDLDDARRQLWDMIEVTANLDWLLLTKRPENIARLIDQRWLGYPRPNVWLGATVENQEQADKRIPHLLQVPAVVRFLSCEPMLGPVDLGVIENTFNLAEGQDWLDVLKRYAWCTGSNDYYDVCTTREGIDWVICGGESGPGSRPMHPEWATSLRDQCNRAGVPFLFKQWGDWIPEDQPREFAGKVMRLKPEGSIYDFQTTSGGISSRLRRVGKKAAGRLLDGREWNGYPLATTAPNGVGA